MQYRYLAIPVLSLTAILILACGSENTQDDGSEGPSHYTTQDFAALERLTRTWVRSSRNGELIEEWTRESDTRWTGNSRSVTDSSDEVLETLVLELDAGRILYTATVEHNPGPVSFTLVHMDSTGAVFENPDHDFPNRITYRFRGEDSLLVRIEGIHPENKRHIDFHFGLRP